MTLGPQFDEHIKRARERAFDNLDVTRGTHGTVTHDGSIPDEILPSSSFGTQVWNFADPGRTYYTAHRKVPSINSDWDRGSPERAGWKWAADARQYHYESAVRPRMVNLHVQPVGNIDLDMNLNARGEMAEMTADRLKVTDVDWIPPITDSHTMGIQGTLPYENWNKYDPHGGNREDANFKRIDK